MNADAVEIKAKWHANFVLLKLLSIVIPPIDKNIGLVNITRPIFFKVSIFRGI